MRRYLGVMMRSVSLLWGNNRVEWIKEKKKDVGYTSFEENEGSDYSFQLTQPNIQVLFLLIQPISVS